jgi:hypothetical protein
MAATARTSDTTTGEIHHSRTGGNVADDDWFPARSRALFLGKRAISEMVVPIVVILAAQRSMTLVGRAVKQLVPLTFIAVTMALFATLKSARKLSCVRG